MQEIFLRPMRQFLTIQENNSLGFQMNIPEEGIDIYDGKGILYDHDKHEQ